MTGPRLYCTRCGGPAPRATDAGSIDPTKYLYVACPACELRTIGTPSLELASRLVAIASEKAAVAKHRRHLVEGRTVRSCGRCLEAIAAAAAIGLHR